jgi:cytochrome b561
MLKNSTTQWGSISRAAHWIAVLLIAVELPVGFWMADLIEVYNETKSDDIWALRTINVHQTVGFLILILTILRVNWRLNNPTPDLPASHAAYQRYLARVTQVFLYILMIFYPLTGWAVASTSAGDFPIFFFGLEIPRMVTPQSGGSSFAYDLFSEMHQACWKIGAALLALHVSGALWGQFIKRNRVLERMWQGND